MQKLFVPGDGVRTWCLTTEDGGESWVAELLEQKEGFSPSKVYISGDGKYLTLGTYAKRVLVLKNEG